MYLLWSWDSVIREYERFITRVTQLEVICLPGLWTMNASDICFTHIMGITMMHAGRFWNRTVARGTSDGIISNTFYNFICPCVIYH